MPTGVTIREVRKQLFDAAERVLLRDGANAVTSRAVTTEAGCAKGVLHKHFTDFDAFLLDLVDDRAARLDRRGEEFSAIAGTGTVVDNLTDALMELYGSVALGLVGLIIARDELRARIRERTRIGLPVLNEGRVMLARYLAAERDLGRVPAHTDVETVALLLIGTGHVVFAGRHGEPPPVEEVRRFVTTAIAT